MTTRTPRAIRLPTTSRYEFQAPIGSGGMGTVYRALDLRDGQLVAIKVMKYKLSENPTLHQRLAREFRAASELEHPNIVRALSIENDGEISYLVYELIEGGNLGDHVEEHGRLPEDVAIRIITQIAQALQYAHGRHVIHRDVKPDNILLQADGRVKLTDFGLAKDYSAEDQELTRAASGLGTPHFMAPEQFADAKTADARCDVYSLAATLYNLLTGVLPFDAKFALAMLAMKETCNYPPASRIVPGLNERIDVAIRAALDPDADKRPASCLEFFKLLTGRRRLKDPLAATPAPIRTLVSAEDNRRTSIRFPLRVGSSGVVDADIHGGDSQEFWPLVVRDVSAQGIGILLARRFEPGAELAIELTLEPGRTQQVPARVVRVQSEHAGHWIHGCEFERALTAEQLRALVKYA